MRSSISLALGCALAVWACQGEPQKAETSKVDLKEVLPGTWETKFFQIKMPTHNDSDSTSVFEASEEYWEAKFQVKPYRTYFGPDQKYRTAYRGLQGHLISESRGVWNAFGDTLMMIQKDGTLQYKLLVEKGQAHFSALLDWDQDGEEDDEYYMIYRLVSKSSAE